MALLAALSALGAASLVVAGGWFGRHVPVAEQWPMFEALRTTAAIIFAVIGAWMAIIYPDRLKLSFTSAGPDKKVAELPPTGWGQLFTPVVHSTLILGVVLALGALLPLLRHSGLPIPVVYLRAISYGLLVALTLWQMWTVVLTLVPADRVKSSLDASDARAKTVSGFLRTAQRAPKHSADQASEEGRPN